MEVTQLRRLMLEENWEEFQRRLLENETLAFIKDRYGWTLLHYAAFFGKLPAVRYLRHLGSKVNSLGNQGRTPLLLALLRGQSVAVIRCLLEGGADMNLADAFGLNPLRIVFRPDFPRRDVIREFFHRLLVVQSKTAEDVVNDILLVHGTTLVQSALSKDVRIVEMIRNNGFDINSQDAENITPLHIALENNDETLTKWLIEHGADAKATSKIGTTVYLATRNENLEMVKLMLERGADPNYGFKNFTPMFHAIVRDSFESYPAESEEEIKTRERNLEEIIAALLLHGATLPRIINDSFTIFDLAILNQHGCKRIRGLVEHLALLDLSGKSSIHSYFQVKQEGSRRKFVCVEKFFKRCCIALQTIVFNKYSLVDLLTMRQYKFRSLIRNEDFVPTLMKICEQENLNLAARFTYLHRFMEKRLASARNAVLVDEYTLAFIISDIFDKSYNESFIVANQLMFYLSDDDLALLNSD